MMPPKTAVSARPPYQRTERAPAGAYAVRGGGSNDRDGSRARRPAAHQSESRSCRSSAFARCDASQPVVCIVSLPALDCQAAQTVCRVDFKTGKVVASKTDPAVTPPSPHRHRLLYTFGLLVNTTFGDVPFSGLLSTRDTVPSMCRHIHTRVPFAHSVVQRTPSTEGKRVRPHGSFTMCYLSCAFMSASGTVVKLIVA